MATNFTHIYVDRQKEIGVAIQSATRPTHTYISEKLGSQLNGYTLYPYIYSTGVG